MGGPFFCLRASTPPAFLSFVPSVPLEDHGAADEDADQQDHGPDGRKGSGLRGGRGLALGEAGGDDQGGNDVLCVGEGGKGEEVEERSC